MYTRRYMHIHTFIIKRMNVVNMSKRQQPHRDEKMFMSAQGHPWASMTDEETHTPLGRIQHYTQLHYKLQQHKK